VGEEDIPNNEEEEDAVEELAAEVAGAAEAAELKQRGERIVREHAEAEAKRLAEARERRSEELYAWTIETLVRIQQGPLDFRPSSSVEPGSKSRIRPAKDRETTGNDG
jgi:hypothetical protein